MAPSTVMFGVYLHVPFCTRRCDYCAFATWADRSHLMGSYVDACRREIRRAVDRGLPPAETVYVGGGTPSLLPPEDLQSLLDGVPRVEGAEVTVECNPEHASAARLAAYRSAGVTRISFGVQSMVPTVLVALGRQHDPDTVRRAAAAAGDAGFAADYSVDLIFGAVGERPEDWAATLDAVLALDPSPAHVSAYSLIPEPGTPLGANPARHPDPDDQADKYAVVDERLAAVGLEWYEISNWAAPGRACRHNQLYWRQGEYRGFGCAAHSHAVEPGGGARRWWNVRTPDRYIRAVLAGEDPVGAGEHLAPAARAAERLELALRTRDGVALADLPDGAALGVVLDAGLVEEDGERLRLTRPGRLLATEVTLRLMA